MRLSCETILAISTKPCPYAFAFNTGITVALSRLLKIVLILLRNVSVFIVSFEFSYIDLLSF